MAVTSALLDATPLRTSPHFRRLWLGQTTSALGTQTTQVAVLYQLWQATSSPIWTGTAGLAQAVPLIALGGPPSGFACSPDVGWRAGASDAPGRAWRWPVDGVVCEDARHRPARTRRSAGRRRLRLGLRRLQPRQ
ncbi:hypothetical protein FHU30_006822 [Actinomadura rupiterrae]|nr:hypothetical protein [Actinomadura rupiterrae]